MQGIIRWTPAHNNCAGTPEHVRSRKSVDSDRTHKIKLKRKRRKQKGYR